MTLKYIPRALDVAATLRVSWRYQLFNSSLPSDAPFFAPFPRPQHPSPLAQRSQSAPLERSHPCVPSACHRAPQTLEVPEMLKSSNPYVVLFFLYHHEASNSGMFGVRVDICQSIVLPVAKVSTVPSHVGPTDDLRFGKSPLWLWVRCHWSFPWPSLPWCHLPTARGCPPCLGYGSLEMCGNSRYHQLEISKHQKSNTTFANSFHSW